MDGKAINDPAKDPYTFIKAEDFFNLDGFVTPVTATLEREVVPNPNRDAKIVTSTGAMFKLEAGHDKAPVYLLIQFVRAQVFRLRLDPSVTNEGGNQYQDFNSWVSPSIMMKFEFYDPSINVKPSPSYTAARSSPTP